MQIFYKYDIKLVCREILKEYLDKFSIPYRMTETGIFQIQDSAHSKRTKELEAALKRYGIQLINNSKGKLVQQIKEVIHEVTFRSDSQNSIKLSERISTQLNMSYSYLSKIFNVETGTSIENYMILSRIELVKQYLADNRLSISDIAWKLNFSSVAHLSNQFKKITGSTPSDYRYHFLKKSLITNEVNNPAIHS